MRKSIAVLMAFMVGVAAVLITFFVMRSSYQANMQGSEDTLALDEFDRVEEILSEQYLNDFDMKEVQNAGLKAMVASLGDPYSAYLTSEEFQAFNQNMDGEYYGLGMQISVDEATGLAVISHFFEGSPAKEAGIEIGDFIVSVDGEDVTKRSLEDISMLCIGEEGTPITMGVLRGSETLEFEMIRRAITMDMLAYEMLNNGIGYMKIHQFGGNSSVLFAEALGVFADQGARGVVIDLRDNGGGYYNVVVEMLDMLLPAGTLVYTEDKYGSREMNDSDASFVDIPVVLLVNGNTASASEIFAGAVQDFDYGEVVGTTTYGKGVVQAIKPTPNGGAVKITISEYFTPKGRSINGNGIYPDYYVELPEGFADDPQRDNDAQLNKAIEALEQRIAG